VDVLWYVNDISLIQYLSIHARETEKNKKVKAKNQNPWFQHGSRLLDILFVQDAPCIRNFKMATALKFKGHRVSLAYTKARLSQSYKELSDDVYQDCIQLKNQRHLWDMSKHYDILHCHNEPDMLTVSALAGDAPVVHDVHDLLSLRYGGDEFVSYYEGLANRGSAGRVYVSEFQKDMAVALYGIDTSKSIVVPNYVMQQMIPEKMLPKISQTDGEIHIVYEGSVGIRKSNHRYYYPLFKELADQHIHVHIYPAVANPNYQTLCAKHPWLHYHQPVSPQRIVFEMTQYDFGIIPFIVTRENEKHLASAMPNKLFEYLAARLPVVARNTYSIRKFYEKHRVGFLFNTIKEIAAGIRNADRKIPDQVPYVFENEIHRVEELYYQLLEK
jgi:glycosyltransferase involved in cell wall biosynthesis